MVTMLQMTGVLLLVKAGVTVLDKTNFIEYSVAKLRK